MSIIHICFCTLWHHKLEVIIKYNDFDEVCNHRLTLLDKIYAHTDEMHEVGTAKGDVPTSLDVA